MAWNETEELRQTLAYAAIVVSSTDDEGLARASLGLSEGRAVAGAAQQAGKPWREALRDVLVLFEGARAAGDLRSAGLMVAAVEVRLREPEGLEELASLRSALQVFVDLLTEANAAESLS